MKTKVELRTDKEECKGCFLCIGVCPLNILEISPAINEKGVQYVIMKDPDMCTGCGMCAIMCPDCAIEVEIKDEEE